MPNETLAHAGFGAPQSMHSTRVCMRARNSAADELTFISLLFGELQKFLLCVVLPHDTVEEFVVNDCWHT